MDGLSKEDFYRAIDELKEESLRTREAILSLRSDLTSLAVGMALLKQDVGALKQRTRDYRGWVAWTGIGALLAALDYLVRRWVK